MNVIYSSSTAVVPQYTAVREATHSGRALVVTCRAPFAFFSQQVSNACRYYTTQQIHYISTPAPDAIARPDLRTATRRDGLGR